MAKRDFDRAASRFLNALRRTMIGLETQQQRILDRYANAPRLLPGLPFEVVDLTDDIGIDLDYYIFELGRLHDAGRSIIRVFKSPRELVNAETEFNQLIPDLKAIRNPLTHPNDNDELDDVGWFSSVVRSTFDGRSKTLIDPRYGQHDAALAYGAALQRYLHSHLEGAIAADPPAPLDEQIASRVHDGPPDSASGPCR